MSITLRPTALPTRSGARTTLVLCLLVALGPCTIDLYLPAFPLLQDDLRASAAAIQLTLTAATVGFAVGQLVVGQWSDSAGRRRPLLWAMGVHVLASVGVAVAPDLSWLLGLRFLQGAGAAGSAVVATAIVRDLFEGSAFVTVLARLALVGGLAPVVAPLVGSQLVQLVGWRGLFACVAGYGLAALALAALLLPESLPADRRVPARRGMGARYRSLLGDRVFVGVALIGGCLVSGVFAYMSSSSFLLQRTYGLDERGYGLVFTVGALAFVTGTQITARVLRRVRPGMLLAVSLPTLAISGFAIALVEVLGLGL
ncbi:MAG: Bcr/CflA family efflux MFS transporter, partial [Jiangellaceae bacterium]